MSSRTAPGAAAKAATPARKPKQGGSRNLSGALAVLDALRRDKLLETVAVAAKELLRSSDLAASLPKVIEQIGRATGVDRTHVFLVDPAAADGHILQHHMWTIPGMVTPPEFHNIKSPMGEVGQQSWIPKLKRGEAITGHVRDFDPAARAFFELGSVKSTL